jgi:hypothetical protein
MSELTDAIMRRLVTIRKLAESGDRGEQATAQSMLANILARHNLTLDDIDAVKPVRTWVELSFVGEYEKVLLKQIIFKVRQQGEFNVRRAPRTRSRIEVELSAKEHVEVEFMFGMMKAAFAKEVDNLMHAFLHTNQLFGPRSETRDDKDDEPELSPERRSEILRIAQMSMLMSPVKVNKAIPA